MNTLDNNRSYLLSSIKRAVVCILLIEWYIMVFVNPCHGEKLPFSFESDFFNKPYMSQKIIDGNSMFGKSSIIQDVPTIIIGLQEFIQFRVNRLKQLSPIFSVFIFPVYAESEQNANQGGNDSQKPTGVITYTVAYAFYVFEHIIYWLIILSPIWIQIYFMLTQQIIIQFLPFIRAES